MASSVEKKKEKAKMSKLKEWVDSLIFALVVATLIRGLFIEPFVIPTSSMEGSLLRGDYLFVSKMAYGARTPKTVLQFPLAHQKIWGTEFNSYVEWITMPYFRLPGIGSVGHDDAVVFNYPYDTLHPVDQRVHYIKRCIGLPGDTLSIESNQAYINGKATANPEKMQHLYQLNTKGNKVINERIFEKLDITEFIRTSPPYLFHASKEAEAYFKTLDFVQSITKVEAKGNDTNLRWQFSKLQWSTDNFGPLLIPYEGLTIPINAETLKKYGVQIRLYEGLTDVKIENAQLLIDGQAVTEYTFKQDYYFMMGDNRHNSEDSRFWGFVPADHIVGKALFIWFSKAPSNVGGGIRWGRIFKGVD